MSQVALNVLIGARDRATPVYRKIGKEITRSIVGPLRTIKRLTKSFSGKSGGLTGFFAGLFSVQAAGNFLKQLVEIEKVTEKIIQINRTAAGSNILSTENLEAVTEISERLGLVTQDAAVSFGKFATAGRLSGLTNKENITIFEDVSIAIAGMRLSADDANGVFKALTQILSKGKVQAEELRGQLGERLPGAFAIFAKSIGVTEQQLSKMLERGEVLSKETLPRFTAELRKTFSGAAVAGAEGLNASLNRLTNSFNGFLKAINRDTPFLKALNSVIDKLTDFLTGDVARGITAALTPIFAFIERNAGPIIALLAGGTGTVAAAGIGALLTTLLSSLGAVAAPLGLLVAGIGALATSFVLLRDTAVQVGDTLAPLKDIVGEQFAQIVDNLAEAFGSTSVTGEFKDTITGLIVEVGNVLVLMSQWVKEILPKFIAGFQKAEVFVIQLLKDISGTDNSLVGALKLLIVPIQAIIVAAAGAVLILVTLAQVITATMAAIVTSVGLLFIGVRNSINIANQAIRSLIFNIIDTFTFGLTNLASKVTRADFKQEISDVEALKGIIKPIGDLAGDMGRAGESINNFIVDVIQLQGRLEGLGRTMAGINVDGSSRAAGKALELILKVASDVATLAREAAIGRGDSKLNVTELKNDISKAIILALRSGDEGLISRAFAKRESVTASTERLGQNREFRTGERIIREVDSAGIASARAALGELLKGRAEAFKAGDFTAFKLFDKVIKESVTNLQKFRDGVIESAKATNPAQRKRILSRLTGLGGGDKLLDNLREQLRATVERVTGALSSRIAGLKDQLAGGIGVDNNFLKSATFGLAGATQRSAELREKQVELASKQFRSSVLKELKEHTKELQKANKFKEDPNKGIVAVTFGKK